MSGPARSKCCSYLPNSVRCVPKPCFQWYQVSWHVYLLFVTQHEDAAATLVDIGAVDFLAQLRPHLDESLHSLLSTTVENMLRFPSTAASHGGAMVLTSRHPPAVSSSNFAATLTAGVGSLDSSRSAREELVASAHAMTASQVALLPRQYLQQTPESGSNCIPVSSHGVLDGEEQGHLHPHGTPNSSTPGSLQHFSSCLTESSCSSGESGGFIAGCLVLQCVTTDSVIGVLFPWIHLSVVDHQVLATTLRYVHTGMSLCVCVCTCDHPVIFFPVGYKPLTHLAWSAPVPSSRTFSCKTFPQNCSFKGQPFCKSVGVASVLCMCCLLK